MKARDACQHPEPVGCELVHAWVMALATRIVRGSCSLESTHRPMHAIGTSTLVDRPVARSEALRVYATAVEWNDREDVE